jgi:hypothetical protein
MTRFSRLIMETACGSRAAISVLMVVTASFLGGCKKAKLEKENVEVVDLRRGLAELQVPASLFDRVVATVEDSNTAHGDQHGDGHGKSDSHGSEPAKSDGHGEAKAESGHGNDSGGHGGSNSKRGGITLANSMDFAEIVVYLTEKNGQPLGGKNYRFEFAKGGGNLDLSSYIQSHRPGEFLFGIEVLNRPALGPFKVYFLSGSKSQKISNDTYGTGCNKIADITDFYSKTLSHVGVELTTKKALYTSQMMGTYLVLYKSADGTWRGGQVTLSDSSNPRLACVGA